MLKRKFTGKFTLSISVLDEPSFLGAGKRIQSQGHRAGGQLWPCTTPALSSDTSRSPWTIHSEVKTMRLRLAKHGSAPMPVPDGEASVRTVLMLRLFSVGNFPLKGRAI